MSNNIESTQHKKIIDEILLERRRECVLGEMNYEGNIGIMELVSFYERTRKNNDKFILNQVDDLIRRKQVKKAWKIIQDYLGLKLSGKD